MYGNNSSFNQGNGKTRLNSNPQGTSRLLPIDSLITEIRTATDHSSASPQNLICLDLADIYPLGGVLGRKLTTPLRQAIMSWCETSFSARGLCFVENDLLCLWLPDNPDRTLESVLNQAAERFTHPWHINIDSRSVPVICNITMAGLSLADKAIDAQDLIAAASGALAISRAEQKIFIHSEQTPWQDHAANCLAKRLELCVRQDMTGFSVNFQPVVNLTSGSWLGLEALCCWQDPELGRVPPREFIPILEQQGLISTLGRWLADVAVEQCVLLELHKLSAFFLSINVSPLQLMDDGFAAEVLQLLDKHNYPPDKLCLEVNCGQGLTFSASACAMLKKLQERGVTVIYDDFSFSREALDYLATLPVSGLKTELAFLSGLSGIQLSYLLAALTDICAASKLHPIAKGIETEEQLEMCRLRGIRAGQGYHLARPFGCQDLEQHIARFSADNAKQLPCLLPEKRNLNQWLSKHKNLLVTPNLFRLLDRCVHILLEDSSLPESMEKILATMGQHFQVARAFAYLRNDDGSYSNFFEWCAPNIAPQGHLHRHVPIHKAMLQAFREDGMLITSDIAELPPPLFELLRKHDVKSLVMLPMWQKDDLVGFLGFNDIKVRDWSPESIIMLWNVCMMLAEKIKRASVEDNNRGNILTEVLNGTGLNVVVSDLETDEIVWVNDVLRAQYDIGDMLVGRKCYEIIQGKTQRCPFCRVPELVANPDLGQVTFEHHNKYWNKTFIVYNSILTWENDRRVHVEYSLDITEQRQSQSQLEYFATMDALTGVMNRSTLLGKLKSMLKQAEQKKQQLSLAFVDVDKLKRTNDFYGHSFGDQLLINAVDAIHTCVRREDITGRLGGDEFLVIFPRCKKSLAATRINRARTRLMRNTDPCGEPMSFSFGVVENTELEFKDNDCYVSELLDIADARMREYKLATVSHKDIR